MPSLSDSIKKDEVIQYELSAITGKNIYLTKEQHKLHFSQTAKFLEEHSNLNALINMFNDMEECHAWCWVKKNIWAFVCNKNVNSYENTLMFFDSTPHIRIFTDLYDDIYTRASTEYTDPLYIASILRKISSE